MFFVERYIVLKILISKVPEQLCSYIDLMLLQSLESKQRADAVKGWLQSNGIDAGRISVNAIGEARPVASNSTEAGRQQNRRVEIVARNGAAQ